MRIQHNIMAMNAYRNYNTNTSALSKNLEKLSSGYKINRAGDDAAGLAISEKMRAQITGLNAAQKNVKDGISLVKTAEGAMQEIQDMLNRMDYLATQSANGTYDDPVDRYNLQKEVNQLRSEINRIADSANFNGIKLLNGDMSLTESTPVDVNVAVDIVGDITEGVATAGGTLSGAAGDLNSKFVPSTTANNGLHPGKDVVGQRDATFSINIKDLTVSGVTGSTTPTNISINVGGQTIAVGVSLATPGTMGGGDISSAFTGQTVTIGGTEFKLTGDGAGKISFQATTAGTCDGNATTINDLLQSEVKVTVTGGDNAAAGGGWVHGVQDIVTAVDTDAGGLAGASFKLDETTVADGNKLTIGDKTFVFKTDKNSNTAASGANETLIDVSTFSAADRFNAAAIKLAQSATNITNAQTVGNTSVTTTFKISSVDGDTIHIDQQLQTGSTANVTYDENMLKGLFTVVQKQTTATPASMELSATPGAASGLNEGDLVSYKTLDDEGNEVTKTFTIGTAPADAKNPEQYKTAEEFNALLQSDATNSLKAAADKVLAGSAYAGKYTVTVSGSNVVIEATEGRGADDERAMTAIKDAIAAAAGKVQISKIAKEDISKGGLTLQIGDTSDTFNQLRVNVGDMHVDAMGTMETLVEGGKQTAVKGQSIDDIDISTQEGAHAAVDVIKNAINYVSSIRGDLGATQNRLEHTANNLSVMAENIQDAESTIRDTDVAEEMMAYTKNNILVQSAQAMLAQANAVPQGVLQLLG